MKEPRCIRIFKTRQEASFAKNVLKEISIESYFKEDKFRELTLKDLGMESRFRLYISQDDINKAAQFLAKKIKRRIEDA